MDELDRLERLADKQANEKAKLEGKLEILLGNLGEEGFTSLDSAEGDMILLDKKIQRMETVFDNKMKEFKKAHSKEL